MCVCVYQKCLESFVMLEKDGDQLDWSCEEWSITLSQRGKKDSARLTELITVFPNKSLKESWMEI